VSRNDWQNNTLDKIFDDLYPMTVKSILDIGCGVSVKSQYLKAETRIGIDIYKPYLDKALTEVDNVIFMQMDAMDVDIFFLPRSIDLIVITDLVEHLEKEDSLKLIAMAERIAKVAVIIETPLGYIPQNIDILGFEGHEYQTHRCGWEKEEFEELGYTVLLRDYKMQDVKRHTEQEVGTDIQLIDAIKYIT
jgi:SAM-dependent methyltransferase